VKKRKKKRNRCPHPYRTFFKVCFTKQGRAEFVVGEYCRTCWKNVRGKGLWVPFREVADLDSVVPLPSREMRKEWRR
jgi:hypothetical protein